MRTSVPASRRCTAKACLSECGVMGFADVAAPVRVLAGAIHRAAGDGMARTVTRKELHAVGRSRRHHVRKISNRSARASRSDPSGPYPCSTRITIRRLSMAGGVRRTASVMRSPAA